MRLAHRAGLLPHSESGKMLQSLFLLGILFFPENLVFLLLSQNFVF